MMRHVVEQGTGKVARVVGHETAGKTGTTQDYRDAWFIGYTSHLIAGVWVGNDDNSSTNRVTGGSMPARIFAMVMNDAHARLDSVPLPGFYEPDGPAIAYANDNSWNNRGGFVDSLRSIFRSPDPPPEPAPDVTRSQRRQIEKTRNQRRLDQLLQTR